MDEGENIWTSSDSDPPDTVGLMLKRVGCVKPGLVVL